MATKEFKYRGKTEDDLKAMSLAELSEYLPASARRKIKRGFTEQEQILLKKIEKKESNIETHCRDMIILPLMFGETIKIHTGKEFLAINIVPEMVGQRLGEFALTRRSLKHSAPGVGATKSSGALSVR